MKKRPLKTDYIARSFGGLPQYPLILVLFLVLAAGCKVGPEPIAYGIDACHFCRMTIVDRQHGAEMVTTKGKVFKFDAVECMINHLREVDDNAVAFLMVNTYSRPGELLDATETVYLISEGIPSPMGEFVTAFENELEAQKAQKKYMGEVYSMQEIRNLLNK